jgi:flavocytochrome c
LNAERPAGRETNGEIHWDETVDVVVVGSGFAGLTAAMEAAGTGASVLLLEKMKAVGGNSTISDGGIAAPGTAIQKKHGIEDSEAQMAADMCKAGMGLNHPELVQTVARHAREALDWSRDTLGVTYLDRVDQFGGHSVPRCYAATGVSGATIIRRMVAKAREAGVVIRLETHFDALIQDKTGRVIGVKSTVGKPFRATEGGTVRHIEARKGVVLAAGGFSADIAFRVLQDPRLTAEIDTTNKTVTTAEALKAALRVGAAPVHLSHIQLGPWASPDERGYGTGPMFADYILFQQGILLHPDTGTRFVNELADRKVLADSILSVGRPCIGLADERAVQSSGWDIGPALAKGVVRCFDTLLAYAAHYRLPPERLEQTVRQFNRGFEHRKDVAYGKPMLAGAAPIDHPPFYGMRLWPKVHYTMGGIGINEKAEVIDLEGNAIPGLYAAGEMTGGVHGACRLGSCSITECLVFGRIAGQQVATQRA